MAPPDGFTYHYDKDCRQHRLRFGHKSGDVVRLDWPDHNGHVWWGVHDEADLIGFTRYGDTETIEGTEIELRKIIFVRLDPDWPVRSNEEYNE